MTIEQREEGFEGDLQQDLEVIELSRSNIDKEISEALESFAETWDTDKVRFMKAVLGHAKTLSSIPTVKGILLRTLNEGPMYRRRINLLTVFNELKPDDNESAEAFGGVARANVQLRNELKEFGLDFGGSTGKCGEDFDIWLTGRLTLEQNERDGIFPQSSGNEFVDLIRSFDRGYTTIAVLKIE